jgi:hypothetical protein
LLRSGVERLGNYGHIIAALHVQHETLGSVGRAWALGGHDAAARASGLVPLGHELTKAANPDSRQLFPVPLVRSQVKHRAALLPVNLNAA